MSNFPVTMSPGKLPTLFDKINKTGVPSKVNNDWLKAMGLASSRDRSMVAMLKSLGFVDGSGTPTDRWRKWKDNYLGPASLAEAIREGYRDLYAVYPDAHNATETDLKNLINTTTGAGQEMVSLYLSSFKGLARLAKWSETPLETNDAGKGPMEAGGKQVDIHVKEVSGGHRSSQSGLVVNLNIQLTLPDTLDAAGYEAFFAAMKKHLFPEPSNE